MILYDKINLMLPTYKRSDKKLPRFIESALKTAAKPQDLRFTFVVNESDPESVTLIQTMLPASQVCIIKENLPKPHLAKYFNMAYDRTTFAEPGTLVSMLGDDMEFVTQGWDELVLLWANMFNGEGLFYGDDMKGTHKTLCVYFFASRKLVDAQKPHPFMCEMFPVDDMDVIWNYVSKKLRKRFYVPGLQIFHNHATLPGQMDAVWKRMREEMPQVREHRTTVERDGFIWGNDEYEDACVEAIRKVIPETRLGVVMATYDRLELLADTVNSYMAGSDLPAEIYVYDDCSPQVERVEETVARMPGVKFFKGERRLGSAMKTPAALKHFFENTDYDSAIVLDSDCLLHKYWYQRAKAIVKQTAKDGGFGCASLFNVGAHAGAEMPQYPGLLKKLAVGGLSMIVTRRFWKDFILPLEKGRKVEWDNRACLDSVRAGKFVCCSAPSFVQHTGVYEGTHTGGDAVAYASDYMGECNVYERYTIGEEINNGRILFALMGRYGDVLLGSMIANMLIDAGHQVDWWTIPLYAPVISLTCPRAKKIVYGVSPADTWHSVSTKQMTQQHPGYKYYINAQPGAPENHDNLIGSGLSMAVFAKRIAEHITNQLLPADFLQGMQLQKALLPDVRASGLTKPLCLICREVISTAPAISDVEAERLAQKYSSDYNVRFLMRTRPLGLSTRLVRERYIFNLTFLQCFSLIYNHCALFIGNDSGMAWVAMYNRNCKKIIYHTRKRVRETNMLFGKIDPLAEDVVI